ncbi:MAG: hypothetical protein QNJ54_19825 [Prochloraceae cyanobacterium]|nr:hypothetical protein [Prochloraceae cyanobacterium]
MSIDLKSILAEQTGFYMSGFYCELCQWGRILFYGASKESKGIVDRDFYCLCCQRNSSKPIQKDIRKLIVKQFEDTVIIALFTQPGEMRSELKFFGCGRSISEAQHSLQKRYSHSELIRYLKQEIN